MVEKVCMTHSSKPLLLSIVALGLFSVGPARAAQPAPLISPDLLADGGVTFRFKAPKATEVKVAGQFGADVPMNKGTDGVWSVTVSSVPAGVHEYRFVVDGLNVIDPQNPAVKPQR